MMSFSRSEYARVRFRHYAWRQLVLHDVRFARQDRQSAARCNPDHRIGREWHNGRPRREDTRRLGSIWQYHRVPKDASAYLSPMLAGQYQQHLLRYYRGNVSVGKCYEPAIQRLTYEQASICIQAQRLIVNRIGFRGRRFPLCPDPHRMRGRAPHQRW